LESDLNWTVVAFHTTTHVTLSSARRSAFPPGDYWIGHKSPGMIRFCQLHSEDGNWQKVAQSLPNGKPLQHKELIQTPHPQECNSFTQHTPCCCISQISGKICTGVAFREIPRVDGAALPSGRIENLSIDATV